MILVAGLGNPGQRYRSTRHNVGFMVAERLAARAASAASWQAGFDGLFAETELAGQAAVLLLPHTFMNASGRSVVQACEHYRLEPAALVVVHDELDLGLASVRIKFGGGDAGHRGVRSIAQEIGSKDFIRVRAGIGRPPAIFQGAISDYVLEAFALAEQEAQELLLERSAKAVTLIAERGYSEAMNVTNQC